MVGGACTNASMELMEVLARSRGLGELLGVDDGFNDCALGGADMLQHCCVGNAEAVGVGVRGGVAQGLPCRCFADV